MGRFDFKQFSLDDSRCGMKIGTDGVLLGAWADISKAARVIDVGCGSGLIALMLAQRNPDAVITGVEIDKAAYADACDNVLGSPWSERVCILNADALTFEVEKGASPLLIVSNPPFFNEALHSPDEERALARHGTRFGVEELIKLGSEWILGEDDYLAFIAPSSRDDEVEFLLSLHRLAPCRHTVVYSRRGKKPLRSLWQVTADKYCHGVEENALYIRDESNGYTKEYLSLTSPFYLDK